ncbi:MAG TPA: DnaJ domain-containing protein [Thermoanaerobaculia bacterium]|nr:DnaJ domain-containing protein [Thermoanaerobaculia bacterium]
MENSSSAAQRPTDEELRLFLDRIGRRLADHPPHLDAEAHRQRVAGMLRDVGEASFYRLLSIPPTARAQEVHEAYDQIARLVHPANAGRLGLAGREGVLEMLFERLTLAYLTLIQTDRRKAYDRDLKPGAWGAAAFGALPEQRREEVRAVAQDYYQRAMELVAGNDYHLAIELLQQAVRVDDSRPEYLALLGTLQAKNSRWLRVAAENLERAVKLGSRDADLPALLARVRERLAAGEALRPPSADVASPSPAARRKVREVPEVEVLNPDGEEIDVPWPLPNQRTRW